MSSEWVCSQCGRLNSGKVSGMQMGGSFQDLVNQASAAANTCAFCGAKRGSSAPSSSPTGRTATIGHWVLMIAIIVVIALVLAFVIVPAFG